MTVREPFRKLMGCLTAVAAVNLLALAVVPTLGILTAIAAVWLVGFTTAAVIVLRHDFYIRAEDRHGEEWELRWERR